MALTHPAATLIFIALALAIVILALRCQVIEFKDKAIHFGFPVAMKTSSLTPRDQARGDFPSLVGWNVVHSSTKPTGGSRTTC
jgi:hypothetical protein